MADRREPGLRLRRLLAMVAWLSQRGTATLTELAERFGLDEREVEDELLLASMCGLPPYSPDQLIDFLIIDGVVEARVPEYFHKPRRLTAADGLALLTAGHTLLAVPGADPAGPLSSALEKLATALGGGDGAGVAVELDSPEFLAELRLAAAEHAQIEITYYSAARDVVGSRVVDPVRVIADGGHWYLEAYCHTTTKVLTFRADRVEAVRRTGQPAAKQTARPKPSGSTGGPVFHPGADMESVTITVPVSGRWVADTYPVEEVEELKSGRWRITLAVSGEAFLERLLLRLGPDAVVIAPRARKTAQHNAAKRVLARYR